MLPPPPPPPPFRLAGFAACPGSWIHRGWFASALKGLKPPEASPASEPGASVNEPDAVFILLLLKENAASEVRNISQTFRVTADFDVLCMLVDILLLGYAQKIHQAVHLLSRHTSLRAVARGRFADRIPAWIQGGSIRSLIPFEPWLWASHRVPT